MLTIVPTPIGNLQDITLRALEALREADVILCEDTRRTLQLASHFGIKARLERYNEHDERSLSHAMELLLGGKKVALVTDGGTPCVSDPGWKLVNKARENSIPLTSLPGPCAAVTAAAGSGFPADSFVFLGFLPRSPSKVRKALKEASSLGKTVILHESPYRVVSLLEAVNSELGPDTPVAVAREITKIHEEWTRGTAEKLLKDFSGRKDIKGELVVLFMPQTSAYAAKNQDKNTGY